MRFKALHLAVGLGLLVPSLAWADPQPSISKAGTPQPITIAAQGSFFVNQRSRLSDYPNGVAKSPGHLSVDGLYVEYQIPVDRKYAYPIIMIHGAAHTAKTWDETPDGREGWKTYFLRKGFAVYVVDDVGRGRSGFDPTTINKAKVESKPNILPSLFKFTNEVAWTAFRIGPTPYTPYPGTQFPQAFFGQYVAQMVPNTEVTVDPDCQTAGPGCTKTVEAADVLLKKIGPAIVMGHSQGGTLSMAIANASSSMVKAVITVEPASGCIIPDENLPAFKKIGFYSIFGDNTAGVGNWPIWIKGCKQSAGKVKSVGGRSRVVVLPDIGIKGNSHMLMLEKNNIEIADLIIGWINQNVPGAQNN